MRLLPIAPLEGSAALVFAMVVVLVAGCGARARERVDASELRNGDGIPCAPAAVLVRVCQQCHSDPQKNGAPFPLVTYGDTRAEIDGEPLASHMLRAIESERMPLDPVEITAEDREVLLAWLREGGPPRVEGVICDPQLQ